MNAIDFVTLVYWLSSNLVMQCIEWLARENLSTFVWVTYKKLVLLGTKDGDWCRDLKG